MSFELRESVYRYLTEPSLAAGVDALAAYEINKIPNSLTWDEIPQFYRALLSSQQVRTEWVISLEELWREVWPEYLVGWVAITPDEQSSSEYEATITPKVCWDYGWFVRCFSRSGKRFLYTYASFGSEGIQAGLGVYDEKGKAQAGFQKELEQCQLEYSPDDETWWTLSSLCPVAKEPDLADIRRSISAALSLLA